LLAGKARIADDFDDPLPDDVVRAFEGISPGGCRSIPIS
jgi:hypothetical protein